VPHSNKGNTHLLIKHGRVNVGARVVVAVHGRVVEVVSLQIEHLQDIVHAHQPTAGVSLRVGAAKAVVAHWHAGDELLPGIRARVRVAGKLALEETHKLHLDSVALGWLLEIAILEHAGDAGDDGRRRVGIGTRHLARHLTAHAVVVFALQLAGVRGKDGQRRIDDGLVQVAGAADALGVGDVEAQPPHERRNREAESIAALGKLGIGRTHSCVNPI
jgi:hypothetical protein